MRKLELMPEVLPEPKRSSTAADPRARTMAHLQRLMAAAAASGSLVGCTRESNVKDDRSTTNTTPTNTPTAIPSAATSARVTVPDAGTIATVPSTPPTTPPTMGYAVVDPVPAPAACPGLAAEIAVRAWRAVLPTGTSVVDVRLPASGGVDVVAYGAIQSIYGGKVGSAEAGGKTQRLGLAPDAGASTMSVAMGIRCNGRPATLYLTFDLSGAKDVGTAVPLTIRTY